MLVQTLKSKKMCSIRNDQIEDQIEHILDTHSKKNLCQTSPPLSILNSSLELQVSSMPVHSLPEFDFHLVHNFGVKFYFS